MVGQVGFVAFDQLVDLRGTDPVARGLLVAGDFAFVTPFKDGRADDELGLGHGLTFRNAEVSTMSRGSCQLCRETRQCPRYQVKGLRRILWGPFSCRVERA